MDIDYTLKASSPLSKIGISVDYDDILDGSDDGNVWPMKATFWILPDGTIENWPKGHVYEGCWKVVDTGIYYIHLTNETIFEYENEYVPNFLNFLGESYGAYLDLKIDGNGKITGAERVLNAFNVSAYIAEHGRNED